MADVVALAERHAAAGKPAGTVAVVQRAPERRRNSACLCGDFHDATVRIVTHHDPARVACQASGRLRGDVRATLEHGLARRLWIGEHRDVDVNDDLIALARRAGIETVMEGALGEEDQRVRLLLGHGRRFRGNVRRGNGGRVRAARSLVQGLAPPGERLYQHRTRLGRQPPPNDDHTVYVLIHVQSATLVAMRGLARFGQLIDTPPPADDTLDVAGRAGPAHREQPLLGLRRGDTRERPYLGIGELTTGERVGQSGQRAERARHAHALAGGAHVDPDTPRQPVGAGGKAVVPAAAGIELADEIEQMSGGGVEMRGQLGDLVAQPVHLRNGLRGGVNVERADLHG